MGTCVGAAATPVVVDVASRAIVGICPAAEGESQKRQNCHLLQPPLYYFIRGNCSDSFLDDSSNVRTNVSRESTFILRELLKRILSEI